MVGTFAIVQKGVGTVDGRVAGAAVFPVGFDRPEWYNGFEHDPEAAAASGSVFCGAGGDRRAAGGHSPVVPVRRPGWRAAIGELWRGWINWWARRPPAGLG